MPIKKAALKALRQTKKRTLRNKRVMEALNTLIKKSRKSIAAKKYEEAKKFTTQTIKALDKAVKRSLIKKNTAARKKSRLMKALNKMGSGLDI